MCVSKIAICLSISLPAYDSMTDLLQTHQSDIFSAALPKRIRPFKRATPSTSLRHVQLFKTKTG